MTIETKNLLTVIKAYARANKLPLDSTEIWDSFAEAQDYLNNPVAYAGQTIKIKNNGQYKMYIIQEDGDSLVLQEISAQAKTKQFVQIVNELPQNGQEEGVLYLNKLDKTGSFWNGSAYETIIPNASEKIESRIGEIPSDTTVKSYIDSKFVIKEF